jgi:hypothetical protein
MTTLPAAEVRDETDIVHRLRLYVRLQLPSDDGVVRVDVGLLTDAIREIERLRRQSAKRAPLNEVLEDIKDFLQDQHDIVDGANGPLPNRAMSLTTALEEAWIK